MVKTRKFISIFLIFILSTYSFYVSAFYNDCFYLSGKGADSRLNITGSDVGTQVQAKAEAAKQSGEIEKAQQLEQIGIAVDMLSGGLSTPSGNTLATAANTLSPALSYQLGQWAKANDKEGSAEHIAAHMLLGAISGKANDSNALITALSAGGAEAAAPMLAELIYGKASNQLSAKEKDNLAALASLFGTAVGASTGNSLDAIHAANAAENAVGDNQVADLNVFGLMPQVIASDRSAAELYAALLKNGMTPEEASKEAQESLKGNPPKTDPTLVYLTASTAVPAVTAAIATAPAVISGAYYGCISNPALCTEVGIIGTEVTAGLATGAVMPTILPVSSGWGVADDTIKIINNRQPKTISLIDGFYSVDNMKMNKEYYERLWQEGRPAPFIQSREIIENNPKIILDPRGKEGFYQYKNFGLEMIYNPSTGEIWHIQPAKRK